MTTYLLRRLLSAAPTALGAATLVFLLIHFIPGDPVEVMLGETARPEDAAALRAALGLDRPPAERYARFLGGALRGDLGESLQYREPVGAILARRFPATAALAAAALGVAAALAIPLGALAAARKDSALDRALMLAALLGVSLPTFWIGPLLMLVFAVHLGWFPVAGAESPGAIVLPAVTLGLGLTGILARMTRASMLEALSAEHVRVARAKGASEARAVLRHALRNALLPILTLLGLQFGGLLAGSVITETIFSWPGVGSLLVGAIQARDFPLAQGCVLLIALGYVAANLGTDLLYAAADPRVRLAR